jgi:hypothetical protein
MRELQMQDTINLSGLRELRDTLRTAADVATVTAADFLAGVKTMRKPKVAAALTDTYRSQRVAELAAQAQQALRDHGVDGLRQRAAEALKLKEQYTSPDFALRRARFVVGMPEPVEDGAPNALQAKTHNLMLVVAERLTRADWREELQHATDEDLAGYIQECQATGNAALLKLIGREIDTRTREGREVPVALKATALPEAKKAIHETAPDLREALALLDEIGRDDGRLADATTTISRGVDHHVHTAAARIEELKAEHGDKAGEVYAAESAGMQRRLEDAATARADTEIEHAIRLDESDAARLTIPIGHNTNPTPRDAA